MKYFLACVVAALALATAATATAKPIEVASRAELAKIQDQQNKAFLRYTHERRATSNCHRTDTAWACRIDASQNVKTYLVVKRAGVVKAIHGHYFDPR